MALEKIEMDPLWREWEDRLGLQGYVRKESLVRQEISAVQETEYRIELVWYPEGAADFDNEGLNPPGTVTVMLDARTRRLRSCHLPDLKQGKGSADSGREATGDEARSIAWDWIARFTGLTEEDRRLEQLTFQLEENVMRFGFRLVHEGVPFFPGMSMDIRISREGRLLSYSTYGSHTGIVVPILNKPQQEPGPAALRQTAYQAFSLFYLPKELRNDKELCWFYGVGETFLDGETGETIAYEWHSKLFGQTPLNEPLLWSEEEEGHSTDEQISSGPAKAGGWISRFVSERERRDGLIDWEDEHPELLPIGPADRDRLCETIRVWARKRWPGGSGQWMISHLLRSSGMVVAVIERSHAGYEVGMGRTKVFIDGQSFAVIDEMEPAVLPPHPPEGVIGKAEAFEKIAGAVICKPRYVWDAQKKGYRFMHMVDCPLLVDALSGETAEEL
ncbi:hypothetical protein ACP26L_19520 [Paenibacillus sp. S-38]|uniref:hypothetical protein n=1 Tax=Paenibacillus sp. S-38 TaxID=3416710 RepID=UPI003CF4BDD8